MLATERHECEITKYYRMIFNSFTITLNEIIHIYKDIILVQSSVP